jgi:hypothetical protein
VAADDHLYATAWNRDKFDGASPRGELAHGANPEATPYALLDDYDVNALVEIEHESHEHGGHARVRHPEVKT